MADSEPKTVLLAGATGLVGQWALESLLEAPDVGRVYAVTRRPLGREHSKLANRIVQFDQLESQLKGLSVHAALCCLGTTLRKAGSEEAFREVDVGHVVAFARAARSAQAQRFVVVSSVGADVRSKSFYLRTKGEMEAALVPIGFSSLDVLQPSVLLGRRAEMRPLELLAIAAMPFLNLFLRGSREIYRGIPARTVAAAMVGVLRSSRRGPQRHTYSGIQALARSRRK
ncbi:MAG TPA: NAD(P)H-binding protein [Steroidobacteraceae bacterium]|nr:NAD(P)H-binding protein [Steroidobacteraceae bacterium]